MRHQNRIPHKFQKLRQNSLYIRRIQHHLIGDACKFCNLKRNRHLRVYKCTEAFCNLPIFYLYRADFNDLIFDRTKPGRLQVKHNKGSVQRLSFFINCHILQVID